MQENETIAQKKINRSTFFSGAIKLFPGQLPHFLVMTVAGLSMTISPQILYLRHFAEKVRKCGLFLIYASLFFKRHELGQIQEQIGKNP